jgi:hypothetical protein
MWSLMHILILESASDRVSGARDISDDSIFERMALSYRFTKLFSCSAINSSTDLIPSYVGIYKETFVYRRACCQCQQDWSQRTQLIVKSPSLIDVLGLESDLETAAAHAKSHGIHVDMVFFRSSIPYIIVLGPDM